jgi:hypothetical protein
MEDADGNSLVIGRGGRFSVTLPDGTKIAITVDCDENGDTNSDGKPTFGEESSGSKVLLLLPDSMRPVVAAMPPSDVHMRGVSTDTATLLITSGGDLDLTDPVIHALLLSAASVSIVVHPEGRHVDKR